MNLYSVPSTSSTVEAGSRAECFIVKHIASDPEAKESCVYVYVSIGHYSACIKMTERQSAPLFAMMIYAWLRRIIRCGTGDPH